MEQESEYILPANLRKENISKEQILEIVKNYRPIDDDFMRELFRNNIPLTECVLRIITGIKDLVITSSETQYDMKRLSGSRSLKLDVFGTDSTGKKINLEVQRADEGATPKRARYHSSAIDIESLKSGDDFSQLPETYVIFITENDVMGKNKLVYRYKWREEDGSELGDETHIIYVNASYDNPEDTSELAKLVHDFMCINADEMYTEPLAEITRQLKGSDKEVGVMCKAVEELVKKSNDYGKRSSQIEIACNLISLGNNSYEDIAKVTSLTLEEVNKLAEEIKQA